MTNSPSTGPFEIKVDGQSAESWHDTIQQFADANLYQTWTYGAVRWGSRNLSHLVISRQGQVMAAAQLRIARVPLLPAGVAYLRWGPLCQRRGEELDPAVVREMMACLRTEYCQRRGLALQIIPHAFAEVPRGTAYADALQQAELQPDPAAPRHRTVVVDLAAPPEELRKRLDKKWRNQLNGSEKNGLVLEQGDGPEGYREFLKLYAVMWEKKQFDTTVDVEEFGRIQEQLTGPARMQTFLARKDGEAVGALVCSLLGDTAIYVLGATNDRARELKAAYFLHWQAMLWLKERGARWYDLGGIDPVANPGGYHFKSGFGGAEVTQLPLHARSGGALGSALLKGIAWLRRRKAAAKAAAPAAR